jgi:hypothetical protein
MRVTLALGLLGLASSALASPPPPPAGGPAPPAPPPANLAASSSHSSSSTASSTASHSSSVTRTSTSSSSASSSSAASCTDTATYQCLKGVPFPHMINATLDELSAGLAASELLLCPSEACVGANSVQSFLPLLIWSTLTRSVSPRFRVT